MEGRKKPASGRTPTTRRAKRVFGFVVVFCSVVLILGLSLYPFTFEQLDRITHIPRYFTGIEFPRYSRCCTYLAVLEPLANLLLYVPLGLGLAGLLGPPARGKLATLGRVYLLSLGLSFLIEVLQVFQPWRSPYLTDVLMNSLGGGVGCLCYLAGRALWKAFRVRREDLIEEEATARRRSLH